MRALGLVVVLGCRQPGPPPTVVPQPPSPPTAPADPPADPPSTPPAPPSTGPVPLVSAGKPRPTSMGTQAELAADKAWEGEEHYRGGRYAEASASFRDSVARVPEPRAFYNLCASLYMEGKFGEALVACDAVGRNRPTAELRERAETLAVRVKHEARVQGIDVAP